MQSSSSLTSSASLSSSLSPSPSSSISLAAALALGLALGLARGLSASCGLPTTISTGNLSPTPSHESHSTKSVQRYVPGPGVRIIISSCLPPRGKGGGSSSSSPPLPLPLAPAPSDSSLPSSGLNSSCSATMARDLRIKRLRCSSAMYTCHASALGAGKRALVRARGAEGLAPFSGAPRRHTHRRTASELRSPARTSAQPGV
mmetsp:Transcript_18108/g.56181  ORF Transcript_18108/g.56181 Transcript_18108/m.56181 type:complete len:202 (-) Transcript_18108:289-894(-)